MSGVGRIKCDEEKEIGGDFRRAFTGYRKKRGRKREIMNVIGDEVRVEHRVPVLRGPGKKASHSCLGG